MDKSESKRVIVNTCSSEESKSKIVRISVNTSEVKYAKNETKDEEPLVTDTSVINGPNYFKLFCAVKVLEKLDTMCDHVCVAYSKDEYYTELCNTIIN